MNEVKYRAWDKVKKKMVYDIEEHWDCRDCEAEYGGRWIADNDCQCFGDFLDNDRYDVMQHIFRRDIIGKRIYDGDIIVADDENNGKLNVECVVKWSNIGYRFHFSPINSYHGPYGILGLRNIRVIGNIYENPELEGD
jgi:hypothetical protein